MINGITCITQPDFFPWLGYFDKLIKADNFVFLDHVTNRPGDGIWTKRVKIIVSGKPIWLTVPLKKDKEKEFLPINEMEIDFSSNFVAKHLSIIKHNYSKHPFFKEVYPLIEEVYNLKEKLIYEWNIFYIKKIRERLNIKNNITFSSNLNCSQSSNLLLIEIAKKVNADKYLYGEGSLNYLKPELWAEENITLIPQNFSHPGYVQKGTEEFVAGLSSIDGFMNVGFENIKNILSTV